MSTCARIAIAVVISAVVAAGSSALFGQSALVSIPQVESQVDKVFARWSTTTPGCAVGASVDGKPVLAKAYGMADLERNVPNTAETIFEAGSVSKQFTAAAVLLLAKDGKLALDDPVRKHIPELPDYGSPLTIRHMLNHSSGLRDWGSVASLGGWPRTTRAYTHAHVLDIVSRQRAVNFTPGTRYSYSNSGYNLAAILVSRLSGMSFAEFSQKRIFGPLGLTRTSWRDDHTRIVKNRAIAYTGEAGAYRILMPFENVHGNGGLLTTVGDLLKWNEHFAAPTIGDRSFVNEQEGPGQFNDGRRHGYALGLMVGSYKGVRQVAHSGSTAGYSAYLTRYPDQKISVAVLCNGAGAPATQFSNQVADLYLGDRVKAVAAPTATHTLTAAEITSAAGLYRDTFTGEAVTLVAADGGLRIERGAALVPQTASRFVVANGATWEIDRNRGTLRVTDSYGTVDNFERVVPTTPTAADLNELVGTYVSDEAEATMQAVVESGALVLKRRPDTTVRLSPIYKDAFSGQLGTVIFRRQDGRVTEFSVSQDRVWDLRFRRQPAATRGATPE
jgi:CubicO group peptidase (beta-lactamase class C family)